MADNDPRQQRSPVARWRPRYTDQIQRRAAGFDPQDAVWLEKLRTCDAEALSALAFRVLALEAAMDSRLEDHAHHIGELQSKVEDLQAAHGAIIQDHRERLRGLEARPGNTAVAVIEVRLAQLQKDISELEGTTVKSATFKPIYAVFSVSGAAALVAIVTAVIGWISRSSGVVP